MPNEPDSPDANRTDPASGADTRLITARLDLLEGRLIEIERRLGIRGAAPATPEGITEPEVPERSEGGPVDEAPSAEIGVSPERKRAIVRDIAQSGPARAPATGPESASPLMPAGGAAAVEEPPATASGAPARARSATPAKPERAPISLEQFIGGKSFLVLGALIVVIGAGFFLKLAIDEGWIGSIPPLARCLAAGTFGAALLLVGEIAVKKLGRFAAAGFRAAGLGVLYATSYAAYGAFELVSATGAFVLLVSVCGLGVGIALRGRSVMLAVLSLVGGYLAPVVAASEESPAWALAAHVLALLIVGSVIAVRVPYQRVLATLTWWGTALFGTVWITMVIGEHPGLVIGFVFLVWPVVHWTRLGLPPTTRTHVFWAGMPGAASFSTTVWSVGALVLAAAEIDGMRAWHASAIGLAATLGLAVCVSPAWRSLLARPEGQRGVIGASLIGQASALLPLTFLLIVEPRWGELLVFVLLGAAAFWAGRRIEAWAMIAYGSALLALGTAQVLLVPFGEVVVRGGQGSIYLGGVVWGGWFLTPWMWLVAASAAAWMLCGWLSEGWMVDPERGGFVVPRARAICASVGCVLLPIVFVHGESAGWAVACGWYSLVAGASVVWLIVRDRPASLPVFGYLAIATLLTLSLPATDDASYANTHPMGGLVLSWWMLMVGLVGVSWLVCGWRCFRGGAGGGDPVGSRGWVAGMRSLCLAIGCVVLPIMFLHGDATREGVMAGWFGLTLVSFAASRSIRHAWGVAPSVVYLLLVTLAWVGSFLVPGWMGGRGPVPLFVHPGLIWSVVIAGSWGVHARVVRGSRARAIRESAVFAWWIGGVMLLISTTLEVARFAGTVTDDPTARAGSVSIWWAVVAVGLLAGGFARSVALLRYAGIGLLLIATGKVLTYDLAELSPAVRVGSFIGCGLVLLGVAAGYLRVGSKRLENTGEKGGVGGGSAEDDLPG